MKRYLLILVAVFIVTTGTIARGGAPRLGWAGSAAAARDRGQDRDDERRDRDDRNRHDHDRFDDRDRQAAREWYEHHRDRHEFRDRDRWSPEYEGRMREGYVLDSEMRRMCRPVPAELTYRLGPCPRGYRYVIVGGHVCLIDEGYRVHDVIHLEFNIR